MIFDSPDFWQEGPGRNVETQKGRIGKGDDHRTRYFCVSLSDRPTPLHVDARLDRSPPPPS